MTRTPAIHFLTSDAERTSNACNGRANDRRNLTTIRANITCKRCAAKYPAVVKCPTCGRDVAHDALEACTDDLTRCKGDGGCLAKYLERERAHAGRVPASEPDYFAREHTTLCGASGGENCDCDQYPAPAAPCCELDTDGDGDCPVHPAPRIVAPAGQVERQQAEAERQSPGAFDRAREFYSRIGSAPAPVPTPSPIVRLDVARRDVDELRKAIADLEPHEHFEGMNECATCDEPLLRAAARLLRKAAAPIVVHRLDEDPHTAATLAGLVSAHASDTFAPFEVVAAGVRSTVDKATRAGLISDVGAIPAPRVQPLNDWMRDGLKDAARELRAEQLERVTVCGNEPGERCRFCAHVRECAHRVEVAPTPAGDEPRTLAEYRSFVADKLIPGLRAHGGSNTANEFAEALAHLGALDAQLAAQRRLLWQVRNALAVFLLDSQTRMHLDFYDPKGIEQAEAAFLASAPEQRPARDTLAAARASVQARITRMARRPGDTCNRCGEALPRGPLFSALCTRCGESGLRRLEAIDVIPR